MLLSAELCLIVLMIEFSPIRHAAQEAAMLFQGVILENFKSYEYAKVSFRLIS
jgi:hypothetical protein